MKAPAILLMTVAVIGSSGCMTYPYAEEEDARARAAMENANQRIRKLEDRVSQLEAVNESALSGTGRQAREMEQLQRQDAALAERIAGLERSVATLDAARAADREETVNAVSRRVSDLIQKSAPPPAPSRSVQGYEHIVKPGETLSQIAAAYKTKPSVIIEANALKNPNSLKAGQKLFIPE